MNLVCVRSAYVLAVGLFDVLEYFLHAPGHDPPERIVRLKFEPFHRVGLPSARLSVCKDGRVVALVVRGAHGVNRIGIL